jgi:hypothetical protein
MLRAKALLKLHQFPVLPKFALEEGGAVIDLDYEAMGQSDRPRQGGRPAVGGASGSIVALQFFCGVGARVSKSMLATRHDFAALGDVGDVPPGPRFTTIPWDFGYAHTH